MTPILHNGADKKVWKGNFYEPKKSFLFIYFFMECTDERVHYKNLLQDAASFLWIPMGQLSKCIGCAV